MDVWSWVLAAVAGWTAMGVLGTVVSLGRGERRKAWRGMGWMAGVWLVYLGVLLGVARWQRQRVLGVGEEECFGTVCFAVTGLRSVGEFKGRGGGSLLTVEVRVRNRGKAAAGVEGLKVYLVDADGRAWRQTVGVGGIPLGVRLAPGHEAESDPVFRVEDGAEGLRLVLTRGWTGWGWLVIGDTDSMGHRRTVLRLP